MWHDAFILDPSTRISYFSKFNSPFPSSGSFTGGGAVHWSMVNLLEATHVKKTDSLSPGSHPLSTAPQGWRFSDPHSHSMLEWRLARSRADPVQAATAAMSAQEQCPVMSGRHYSALVLPLWSLRLGGDGACMSHLWLSTCTSSAFWPVYSLLVTIHGIEKFLWWGGWRVALFYI